MRRRLLWVFVALGVGASLTWWFRTTIILWLIAPAGDQLSATGRPIFTNPTEMFAISVGLAMKGGLVAAFPVIVYNVFRLLRPLLGKQQRRFVALSLPLSFVCYLTGTAFTYFVLLPTGLGFLLQFGTDVATPMIRITEYMNMVLSMFFWMGVVFELPLAMWMLAKLRVISYKSFKKLHRYVPAMAFILSALITPTFDAINQTLFAVPLILLFEVGVFLAWMARPGQAARGGR